MINTSLGTAARAGGGGGPCFKLLASLNHRLATGCASDAVDARDHGKPRNSERMAPASRQEHEVVVVAALACPPPLRDQEPVNNKRGCDFNGEMIWASKKQRSSIAAAREHGNAIAEVKRTAAATSSPIAQAKRAAAAATAATSSPIVQEPKGHAPWGCIGVAPDEKKEEKLRPCMFAAPVCGLDGLHGDWEFTAPTIALRSCRHVDRDQRHSAEEECWLIKRSRPCPSTMAVCEGSNRIMPSAQSTEIQEPTSRSNPVQEAKAAGENGRETANSSGRCNTPMRPFMSLSHGLQFLGVTDVTPILARTLTATDCRLDQSRVQFSPREVIDSPLFSILTTDEHRSVHQWDSQKGLELEAIDRHGYSYNMRFKYVYSARQYRLMQAWVPFLRQNGVRQGDLVEVGAFRVDGKPVLTLLNYATEGWIPEEIEAAKGLLMLSDCNNGTKS